MKKFYKGLAVLLAATLVSVPTVDSKNVDADEKAGFDVYVTIVVPKKDDECEEDSIRVFGEKVFAEDVNGDGKVDIDEVFKSTHKKYGVEDWYHSSMTSFGPSMDKLWGTANGGSYGYYVNDVSAYSLTAAVAPGDKITAFAYKYLSDWSDVFGYSDFERSDKMLSASDEKLTLNIEYFYKKFETDRFVTNKLNTATFYINDVYNRTTTTKTLSDNKLPLEIDMAGVFRVWASDVDLKLIPIADEIVVKRDINAIKDEIESLVFEGGNVKYSFAADESSGKINKIVK